MSPSFSVCVHVLVSQCWRLCPPKYPCGRPYPHVMFLVPMAVQTKRVCDNIIFPPNPDFHLCVLAPPPFLPAVDVRCADRRALFVSKWHFRRRPWPLRVSWNPWRPRTSWLYPYPVRAHTPLCSQSMLATPNALPITLASSSRLHPDAHHTGYQGKKGRDAKRLPASQCGMQVPLACIRAPLHVYD